MEAWMKLRKNQKVKFTAIDDFTGEISRLEGIVLDEGYHYIKTHQDLQEEHGEILEGEAYIIEENSRSERRLHLVLLEDILIEWI